MFPKKIKNFANDAPYYLCGPAWYGAPLLLGFMSHELSFQWQLSSKQIASPYLNNKTTNEFDLITYIEHFTQD